MTRPIDPWYVRLPDGKVLKATSTRAVRHHVKTGQVPLESRVRRSADEEWSGLEWTAEFADLVKRLRAREEEAALDVVVSPSADRGDSLRLQTLGVCGFVDELLAALDSALLPNKLTPALLLGVVLGLLGGAGYLTLKRVFPDEELAVRGLQAGIAFLLIVPLACIVTQLTYLELTHLRGARFSEGTQHLFRSFRRVFLLDVLLCAVLLALVLGVRWLPGWLEQLPALHGNPGLQDTLLQAAGVAQVLIEFSVGALASLLLLIPPIVVIEESSAYAVLGIWGNLLREHLLRVLVYEGMAATLGLVLSLPLLIPLAWVHTLAVPGAPYAQTVLQGIALAPLATYLVVANVSIYLNLRYERAPRRRGA